MIIHIIEKVSEEKLIKAIQKHIKSQYSKSRLNAEIYKKWKVGVTNNPDVRYKQNLPKGKIRLTYWKCWDANTKNRALKVEKAFCQKGFSRCISTGFEADDSKFVYVFRVPD
ncbi:MAG: hypothetical protein AB8E82_11865 [Aureispira sp.]